MSEENNSEKKWSASGIFDSVSSVIGDTGSAVKDAVTSKVNDAGDAVKGVVNDIQYEAESAYHSVTSTIEDKVDNVKATVEVVKGIAETAMFTGVIIAGVVAPIPTIIGVAALSAMCVTAGNEIDSVTRKFKNAKANRQFENSANFIRKYGKLPETGIVENDLVKVSLDTKKGMAEGTVKKGHYAGRSFSELSIEELTNLAEHSPDEATKSLIEAYVEFRSVQLG